MLLKAASWVSWNLGRPNMGQSWLI